MRIFSIILPVRVSALLFSELVLTCACYLGALLIYFQRDSLIYLIEDQGWARLLLVSSSVLLGLFVNNLYAKPRFESRVALLLTLCNVFGIALVAQGLLAYLLSGLTLPRMVMIWGSAAAFVVLALWRLFYGSVILKILGTRKIIFLGRDAVIDEIAARVRAHPEQGYSIAGYIGVHAAGDDLLGEYLGPLEEIEEAVRRTHGSRIIAGALERGRELPIMALLRLTRHGVSIEEAATAYESFCGRVCSRELRPSQLIFQNEMASRPGSLALQAIYTNLLALAAIILLSPVLILLALGVKLTSRGPLLEPDMRLGLDGIPFSLHKFRCHRVGPAESRTEQLTRVGRWLVALHLANLPRLFNLLRGEITLVGPPPERPEFASELTRYFAFYRQRHSVKPGMTGWSQINTSDPGREVDSLVQLEYDLYYTKHISLALDAYILLHGLRSMLPFARH